MGIPQHYSRDVPQRCDALIEELLPIVEAGLAADAAFGGPLKTTFLLALATPMIVLPVERVFKRIAFNESGVADDREIDGALDQGVQAVLDQDHAFGDAPFGFGRWAYAEMVEPFNVGQHWPGDVLRQLSGDDARVAAQRAPAWRVLQDLRNALAHGGVAYLDANGRASSGAAEMLGFAGAVMKGHKVVGLNVLRVEKEDFRSFLSAWATWLREVGVSDALGDSPPLAA
jgi:hypothetical protein